MNYGRKNVFPFKGNAEYFGVWCRSPFVIRTIKRVFAWQWKFMVALLCPNNSHIVSRTDSPCRKQQACYQSHIFAYCETSPPFFLPDKNIWRNSAALILTSPPSYKLSHSIKKNRWPIFELLFIYIRHDLKIRGLPGLFTEKTIIACFYLFIHSLQSWSQSCRPV